MTTMATPTQPKPIKPAAQAPAPVYNPKSESAGGKRAKSVIFQYPRFRITALHADAGLQPTCP